MTPTYGESTVTSPDKEIFWVPEATIYTKPWVALCRPDHEAKQGYVLEWCDRVKNCPGLYRAGPVQQVGDVVAFGYTDETGTKQRAYYSLCRDNEFGWGFIRLTNQAFVAAMQRQGAAGVLNPPAGTAGPTEYPGVPGRGSQTPPHNTITQPVSPSPSLTNTTTQPLTNTTNTGRFHSIARQLIDIASELETL
jgi:hypothetical protein